MARGKTPENLLKSSVRSCLRPWRSHRENDLMRRLIWQWQWAALTDPKPICKGRPRKGMKPEDYPQMSRRAMARLLGVTEGYIRKARREFLRNPGQIQMEVFRRGLATVAQFRQAQLETAELRKRGDVLRRRVTWAKKNIDMRKVDRTRNAEEYWRWHERVVNAHKKMVANHEKQIEHAGERIAAQDREREEREAMQSWPEDMRLARQASDWLTRVSNG